MVTKKRYYLNALFDLELGGYPTGAVKKSAAEMSVLFLPLLHFDDSIVVPVTVPEDYVDYLGRFGFCGVNSVHVNRLVTERECEEVVWGWNDAAVKLLGVDAAAHPDLAAVARVNNRRFCTECAATSGYGVPGSVFCSTLEEIADAITALRNNGTLVIKPGFGGSGYGFVLIDTTELSPQNRERCSWMCAHGGCTVEPWCSRIADLSSGGVLAADGTVVRTFYHTQWVNRHGAFYGIYIDDEDPLLAEWKKVLAPMTAFYLKMVAATGYYGPVGIDSFIYSERTTAKPACAAGIEINGRYTMGFLAHLLRGKFTPDKRVLFRFLSKKACLLPETYHDLLRLLGEHHYRPDTREGILLCSPLRIWHAGRWVAPERSAFFIAGNSRDQIERFDRVLREVFGRR